MLPLQDEAGNSAERIRDAMGDILALLLSLYPTPLAKFMLVRLLGGQL